MLGKTASLKIQTPEGVSFQLPLAGPVSRGIALMIDLGAIITILLVSSIIFNLFRSLFISIPIIGPVLEDFGAAVMILFSFVVVMLYGSLFEWLWKGQTIGKRILRLRVMDERGLELGTGQIVIRNLFRLLDMLPSLFYLTGGISCALTRRCQRIGDIAAGTVVVRIREMAQPEIGEILETTDNSFSSFPHLEARIRQNASPEDARIALDAVIRRNELGKDERLLVFGELANHYRELAEFPEETTLGLSDEQYVRNVVNSLYRKAKF